MKTITDFFEQPIMRLCLLIGLGAIAFAGYNLICWSSLSASDWGTWVGAIGTVATLIGTIWLATSTERERKREARDRAIVAAASLWLRLSKVANGVQFVIDALSGNKLDCREHHYASMAAALVDPGSWEDSEILPLVVLPNAVAANLAAARTGIDHCVRILRKSAEEVETTREAIPERAEMLKAYLHVVRKNVSSAQEECNRLLIDHAPSIFKDSH